MREKTVRRSVILGLIVVLSIVFLTLGQEEGDGDWWEHYFDNWKWSVPVYRGAIIGPPEIEDWEPNGVGIGDYNEDGLLDLVVSNHNGGYIFVDGKIHGRLTVLLGNEQGGFTLLEREAFEYFIESYGDGVVGDILSEDFDEDGHLDLGFPMNGKINILYGDGAGGFADPLTLELEGYPAWRTVACDLNEDGHVDIACADTPLRSVAVFFGNGDGGFSLPSFHPTREFPWTIAYGDFNEDNHVDLVAVEATQTESSPVVGASLLLGKGDGDFEAPLAIAVSEQPSNVEVGDFDGDGHQDLVFLYLHHPLLSFVFGNGDGSFREPIEHPLPEYEPFPLDTGDFDEDGRSDVVIGFLKGAQSRLLLSDGEGGFSRTFDFWTGTSSSGITAVDVDKDGHLDIVNLATGKQLVYVAEGDGQGHLGATWFRASPEPPPSGFTWKRIGTKEVGDFNEDGRMDFVDPDWDGDSVELFLGNEEGGIVEAPTSPFYVGKDPEDIVAGDFNEDGHMDAATAVDNDIAVLLGNGQGGFGAPANFTAGGEPWSLDKGDFNEDGHLDIVTANWWSDNVSCLLGDGCGEFTAAPRSPVSSEKLSPREIASGDFNNDSHLDLVIANSGEENFALLLGDGTGDFSVPILFYVGGDPFAIASGDFNGDGNLDVVVVTFRNTRTVLLGDGKGGFAYMAIFSDWRELYLPLVVRDYDEDGDLDFYSDITFLNTMEGYPEEVGK